MWLGAQSIQFILCGRIIRFEAEGFREVCDCTFDVATTNENDTEVEAGFGIVRS